MGHLNCSCCVVNIPAPAVLTNTLVPQSTVFTAFSPQYSIAHIRQAANCAGRSVKTGLTGAVIVSQWTWAATLLQSSNVAWKYGVSGPFWYAAGATIQVLLFAILAIHVKLKAPRAHTGADLVMQCCLCCSGTQDTLVLSQCFCLCCCLQGACMYVTQPCTAQAGLVRVLLCACC